jgi:hypothetical protein
MKDRNTWNDNVMKGLKERERSFDGRSGWNWLTVMLVAGFDISDAEFYGAGTTVVLTRFKL